MSSHADTLNTYSSSRETCLVSGYFEQPYRCSHNMSPNARYITGFVSGLITKTGPSHSSHLLFTSSTRC